MPAAIAPWQPAGEPASIEQLRSGWEGGSEFGYLCWPRMTN